MENNNLYSDNSILYEGDLAVKYLEYLHLRKKVLSTFLIIGFFVLMLIILPSPNIARADENRLAGTDRYQTAVAISQEGWKKSDYVVLVEGDALADALCTGPLAKKYDAPILFTEKNTINRYTQNEIQRLGATKAILVGGYEAISANVEQTLKTIGIKTTDRIYGSDRYVTSVEIAKRLGTKEVALVSGVNFADALSISAVAAAKGYSILLTPADNLPEVVKMHLSNYKITRTYIIGGTGVVGKNIENQAPSPLRLAGNDRYATNRAVLDEFSKDLDFNIIYLASAENKAGLTNSLAGIALAAQTSSPLVLCGKVPIGPSQDFILKKMTVSSHLLTLGGEETIPSSVLNGYTQSQNQVLRSIFNQKGTYGPPLDKTTISGSLAIEASDITVRNTVIEGDLLLGEGIGNGTVTLENVTVKGRTTIRGGGSVDGIRCDTFMSKTLVIDVPSEKEAVIHLKGKSQVQNTIVLSNCTLDGYENTSSVGFSIVNMIRGDQVTLKGDFGTVNVACDGITAKLETTTQKTTTIKTLNANATQTISGTGTISTANINSNEVVIYVTTTTANVAKGYVAYVSGQWLSEGKNNTSIANIPIYDLSGVTGNGDATLYFSPPGGATQISLKQSIDGGATWQTSSTTSVLSSSSTSAVVTGLINGQTYLFKLIVTGGNRAGDSNTFSLVPTGVPISDFSGTIVSGLACFTFSAAANASSVVLQQSTDGGTAWVNSNTTWLDKNSTSATVTGLASGQTYTFRLVVNGGPHHGYSNTYTLGPF
ncbi:hypothetical protein GQ588_13255 [Dehalobacter restrictus]|uniref:Uncharacterized protein n=2 Tax=Dehalobacter restrictus TaxID=55583 RepID=A0A857DKQ8_9FIRM|nr:hypothetical protein GQ588_13255 [Dehalobacter restrictus]